MPRAPSSKRQQGAASQRDARQQDGGLVGPGKRISKQHKSQSPVGVRQAPVDNAAAVAGASAQPSLPSGGGGGNGGGGMGAAKASDDAATLLTQSAGAHAREQPLGKCSENASSESLNGHVLQSMPDEGHKRIDVNAAKNVNVHRDTGPLDVILTVLRACPLQDTIAILIVLMQVSPLALSISYTLFTFLTFVPPSVTTSSGLSLTEVFDGTHATPSMAVIMGLDVVFILVFLFVWPPLQHFMLDLAQMVIALTLGGGASSRQGATNNVLLCFILIGLQHVSRKTNVLRFLNFRSILEGRGIQSPDPDDPLERVSPRYQTKGWHGWVRTILAIHILTQGVARYVKEWYLRRERRDILSHGNQDPEAGKSVPSAPDTPSDGSPEGDASSAQSSAATISSKKRRKQSAQVRIMQPLWAALASTKIVMVKEYELSHAAAESADSNATDVHNLGNAPFGSQPEQIWISHLGCDAIHFATSHFPDTAHGDEINEDGTPAGAKPFYARVNNAVWPSIHIDPASGPEDTKGSRPWTAEIYGLTPMSNYVCDFISKRTGQVIFSTSVTTRQAKSKLPDAATSQAQNPKQSLRPDSPSTTLKASIAAQDSKLDDAKNRLKTLKKDNHRKITALKKDIKELTSAAQSAGSNDQKIRQKSEQLKRQKDEFEKSIKDIEQDLEELKSAADDFQRDYRNQESAYQKEKKLFDDAKATFKKFKVTIDQELKAHRDEESSLKAKRNKIATRINKADEDTSRIEEANAKGLDEATRRRQVRETFEADIARQEAILKEQLDNKRRANIEKAQRLVSLRGMIHEFLATLESGGYENAPESTYPPQQPQQPHQVGPAPFANPWGPTNAATPAYTAWTTSAPSLATIPAIAPQPPSLPPHAAQAPPFQPQPALMTTRGRSGSLGSNASGFTEPSDNEDDKRAGLWGRGGPPSNHSSPFAMPAQAQPFRPRPPPGFSAALFSHPRHQSEGSGSGSHSAFGSGTGSGSGSGFVSERSSVRSGSGSGGSLRDPTSPT